MATDEARYVSMATKENLMAVGLIVDLIAIFTHVKKTKYK